MPGSPTTRGTAPSPRDLALRLLIASVVVIAIGGTFRREIVSAFLPAFRAIIEAVDSHFHILVLDVMERNADAVIRLRVELARTVLINGHATHPKQGGWLEVTTTLGTVLQPACVAFILALAWPAARLQEFMLRMIVCAALAVIVVLVDAPLDLLAYLWSMFVDAFDRDGFYWIVKYHELMIGGGRLALGAVAGVIAIVFAGGN